MKLFIEAIIGLAFVHIGGTIKYGDKVHLLNQYVGQGTKSYLDACGWSGCSSGVWAVQANTSPNRDSGTGTWEIVSATGTNVGVEGSIKYGDKVHLLNQYVGQGTKSYLDAWGSTTCSAGGKWAVQTSTSHDRDSGTGTWEIVSATGTNIGGSVKRGDKIILGHMWQYYLYCRWRVGGSNQRKF